MKTAEKLFGAEAQPCASGCPCGGSCGLGCGDSGCASGGPCTCESSGGCQDLRSPGGQSTAALVVADYEGDIWGVPDEIDDASGVSSAASGAANGVSHHPVTQVVTTASRARTVKGGTASSAKWTARHDWCATMFVDCCVEVWCRPIANKLLRAIRRNAVHCAVIVKTCDQQYVTYELEDNTVPGNRVAQQGSERGLELAAEGRGAQAFVLTDSVDVDANGIPTAAGWWWHDGVCYECDGCLDPCRVTEDQLLDYPHLGTDYGGPSATYPNSNTFARWVAEQAGYDDSVGPPGAVGWNPP